MKKVNLVNPLTDCWVIIDFIRYYMLIYSIVFSITIKEGYYIGLFILFFVGLSFFVPLFFKGLTYFENLKPYLRINKIKLVDNFFEIECQNEFKVFKYKEEVVNKIKADIEIIEDGAFTEPCAFNYQLPYPIIYLKLYRNDGSFLELKNFTKDMSHSVKLLKFLRTLDNFSYDISSLDEYQSNPQKCIEMALAIKNLLSTGFCDNRVFRIVSTMFSKILQATSLYVIVLIVLAITVGMYLDP